MSSVVFCSGELVAEHHACLWCGQVFRSTHAVQQHMRARGHTRMRFEYELPQDEERVSDADHRIRALVEDYHEFYDFEYSCNVQSSFTLSLTHDYVQYTSTYLHQYTL